MQLLFSSRPNYGHVYPLMPLAHAACRDGHEVVFATTGAFLPKLAALGFATHDVGVTIEHGVDMVAGRAMPKREDGRPDLEMGARLFIDVIARQTALDLAPLLAQSQPDVVVYEHMDFGAAVAAHAAGIPAVCHSISPRMPAEILEFFGNRLDRLWAEHGAAPRSFDLFSGDVYLDIFPTALQDRSVAADPARAPMRPIPFAEPGATVPAWLTAERRRPVVYLTFGTVASTDEVLLPAIEALGSLDVDVLLALGSADGAHLGNVPQNVHVEAFVDQPAVLRHSDLVVHHGGSGTILGALTYGVPQVLLPKGADQFWNADAMAAAGLAVVLEPARATSAAIATATVAELARRRPALEAVRDEIASMPHPARVVDELAARFG